MFSVHERTQRRACRIAFVALCAIPTIATLAWVAYFYRPWRHRDWQHSIESALHVRGEVAQITAPRPNERELARVSLADFETSRQLATIGELNIREGQSFTAGEVSFKSASFVDLSKMVRTWLSSEEFGPFIFHVKNLSITGPNQEVLNLEAVRAECRETSSGSRLVAINADLETDENRIKILVERRADGAIRTHIDGQAVSLPAWLFASAIPGAGRWGNSSLCGIIHLESTQADNTGEFRGKLANVNLQSWIGKSPYHLQARGDLSCEQYQWRNDRLVEARGTLEVKGGQVPQPLIQAIVEKFYATVHPRTAQGDVVDFDRLACHFQLNAAGLTLKGLCPFEKPEVQGCMIVAEGKPWVMQPAYRDLPLAHFVQVVCPLEKHWLPATREATSLAEKLPLPATEVKKQ